MPEEVNRILTDRVSNILFCPTETAIQNLKNEGFENFNCTIKKSGDVMLDGALYYKNLAKQPSVEILSDFVLCTIHRAENTDSKERLAAIIHALDEIAVDRQVILPLHPRTRKIIKNYNLETENITFIDPVGYLEMVWLIDHCSLVMTDSGGLQKEAYFFQKQCITLRDETEWVELIQCGANTLVGSDKWKILSAFNTSKSLQTKFENSELYGNGNASSLIVQELLNN